MVIQCPYLLQVNSTQKSMIDREIGSRMSRINKRKSVNTMSPVSPNCGFKCQKSPKQSKQSVSPQQWSLRYKQLSLQYSQLLEQTQNSDHQRSMQERELARLRADKQRDQKEIYRLRAMLGFMNSDKKEMGVQTGIGRQSASSWATKYEKSTDNGLEISSTTNIPMNSQKLLAGSRRNSPKVERCLFKYGKSGSPVSKNSGSPKDRIHPIESYAHNQSTVKKMNKTSQSPQNKFSCIADSNDKFFRDFDRKQAVLTRMRTESLVDETDRDRQKPKQVNPKQTVHPRDRESEHSHLPDSSAKPESSSSYARLRYFRKKQLV